MRVKTRNIVKNASLLQTNMMLAFKSLSSSRCTAHDADFASCFCCAAMYLNLPWIHEKRCVLYAYSLVIITTAVFLLVTNNKILSDLISKWIRWNQIGLSCIFFGDKVLFIFSTERLFVRPHWPYFCNRSGQCFVQFFFISVRVLHPKNWIGENLLHAVF